MILCGDAIAKLKTLAAESVQCCVTSPPYWGLRDYGTAKWEGGRPECDHKMPRASRPLGKLHGGHASIDAATGIDRSGICRKCGARRIDRQLGLERTPEEYVSRMVQVFREVRRVLRADGTLWLNLGDSYNAHPGQRTVHDKAGTKQLTNRGSNEAASRSCAGLKPKDLVGIPWRVAFALQADGWYLRSDIIWAKPNPMPESVTDRPTKAHEYLFLLAKTRRYFYDADAISESVVSDGHLHPRPFGNKNAAARNVKNLTGNMKPGVVYLGHRTRNRRTVWTVTSHPFKGAHFATFPPKLIEPCILSGCPEGGTVLDPFSGAGTTGLVAQQHGRDFIGIELNPEYVRMARARLQSELKKAIGQAA